MGIFKRKKQNVSPLEITPPIESRVEIELHKNASEEAAEKAKEVNTHLNDLLVQNGFTLKIALAAGAELRHKKTGGKK